LIPQPKSLVTKWFFFWFTNVHGFFLKDATPIRRKKELLVTMGCRYLQKNGTCSHYLLRPLMCRKWPQIERFAYPVLLKGCGYSAWERPKKHRPQKKCY
jgi:Fe-S-cluster containining protein